MSGFLALEDGSVFRGDSVGAEGFAVGEAVFTTAMTGYQEVVTDPSYADQIVCFTAAMVGKGSAWSRVTQRNADIRFVFIDHYQTLRIGKRQGPQQHSVDQTEDRGVGANAKRQSDHCYHREAGMLQEHVQTVA